MLYEVITLKENEKYDASRLKEEHRDNALFVSFAPFEDPKAVVSIILENAGGGSANAAPVVRAMLDAYLLGPNTPLSLEPKP